MKQRSGASTTINVISHNYFDLDLSISYIDFLSLDEALLVRPREADGSLPEVDFMKLSSGSDLVDKGLDIGFPFYSKAPDLGVFELNYFAFPQSHAYGTSTIRNP